MVDGSFVVVSNFVVPPRFCVLRAANLEVAREVNDCKSTIEYNRVQ